MNNHTEKKSVCFICYRKFPDTNFENYSHFVSENGYDVTVVAYREPGQKSFEISGRRKIYRIELPQKPNSRKSRFVFTIEVVKFLRRNHFSIVHIHHTCAFFLLFKIFGKGKAKYIFHSTSHPVSDSSRQIKKKMLQIFLQSLFMDRVLIQSDELKRKLFGIRSLNKALVLPIGFNKNHFYPATDEEKAALKRRLGIQDGYKILLYVGSITKARELDRLIKAFRMVDKKINNVRLYMVGDGHGLKDIVELSRELKINGNVIFTGKIEHRKVREYICAADIGISYVPINDSFTYNPPLKTFEYMACGLPTIATQTESNRVIIDDGFNGVLASDKPEDLAESMIGLLNDIDKQQYLKENALHSIAAYEFGEITKSNLVPIYQHIISTN